MSFIIVNIFYLKVNIVLLCAGNHAVIILSYKRTGMAYKLKIHKACTFCKTQALCFARNVIITRRFSYEEMIMGSIINSGYGYERGGRLL